MSKIFPYLLTLGACAATFIACRQNETATANLTLATPIDTARFAAYPHIADAHYTVYFPGAEKTAEFNSSANALVVFDAPAHEWVIVQAMDRNDIADDSLLTDPDALEVFIEEMDEMGRLPDSTIRKTNPSLNRSQLAVRAILISN